MARLVPVHGCQRNDNTLSPKLLPTFQYTCTYEPGFLLVLLKQLRDLGVPLPAHDWNMPVIRFTGDASGLGKGEILVCSKN
jgi:hypothetical protein